MFVAGIIFSAVGAVCSIIALRKTLQLEKSDVQIRQTARRLKILCIICLSACVLAFVIITVSIVVMFPMILEAAETGDFSALGLDISSDKNAGSSTW